MRKRLAFVTFLLFTACTAIQQQKAAPPRSEFRNLQVFPQDIPREQLIDAMRGFTRALGVKCGECHVVTATEPKQEFDFPSDAKPEKNIARTMLRMTMNINNRWITALPQEPDEPRQNVSCWTCHRGKKEPEPPPPPPPAGQH